MVVNATRVGRQATQPVMHFLKTDDGDDNLHGVWSTTATTNSCGGPSGLLCFGSKSFRLEINETTLGVRNVSVMASGGQSQGFLWPTVQASEWPLWRVNITDCTSTIPNGLSIDATAKSMYRSTRIDKSTGIMTLSWGRCVYSSTTSWKHQRECYTATEGRWQRGNTRCSRHQRHNRRHRDKTLRAGVGAACVSGKCVLSL